MKMTMSTIKHAKNLLSIALNLAFVQHVAKLASEVGHYPEILIYKKGAVRITATTPDEGGITKTISDLLND